MLHQIEKAELIIKNLKAKQINKYRKIYYTEILLIFLIKISDFIHEYIVNFMIL